MNLVDSGDFYSPSTPLDTDQLAAIPVSPLPPVDIAALSAWRSEQSFLIVDDSADPLFHPLYREVDGVMYERDGGEYLAMVEARNFGETIEARIFPEFYEPSGRKRATRK